MTRSMVSPPRPELCHPRRLTTLRTRPKPCHSMPNALPSQAQTSHPRASYTEQPTPVAQSTLAEHPTLVAQPVFAAQPTPVAQLLPWPSLLPWHSKQPRSAQDYLNHSDQPSSRGHFHHVSLRI
ncbi:hypothetical protein COP1_003840 [Malus domestica]